MNFKIENLSTEQKYALLSVSQQWNFTWFKNRALAGKKMGK